MADCSNTPDVRFKGFEGEWVKHKLLDGSIKIGDGLHGTPKYVDEGGVFFINGNNLFSGGICITSETKQVSEHELSKDDKGLSSNSILLSINGTIGNLAYYQDERVMLGKSVAYITLGKFDKTYIYSYLQTPRVRNYFDGNLTGSTIKNLGLKAIRETEVFISKDDLEQSKIGSYFQHIDKLIALHQAKFDKLTVLKKAMLEKMFPKEGSDVPEIRFKEFSGGWEEREVSFLADRYDNLRVPIAAKDRVWGGTPYYGANGIQGYVEGYTHDGEFILIAEDGANDLKNYPVQYVEGKIWVNNHAHVLQAKSGVADNKFLKYAFSNINIEPFLVGGGRAKLNANIMMNINIYIASNLQEQSQIGSYFQNLDKLISLQQQELTKLKNLKKACLDKMFV